MISPSELYVGCACPSTLNGQSIIQRRGFFSTYVSEGRMYIPALLPKGKMKPQNGKARATEREDGKYQLEPQGTTL
jgi:hypothetical protein